MRLVSSSGAHADVADVEADADADVVVVIVVVVGGALVCAAGADAVQQRPVRPVAEKCANATDVALVVVVGVLAVGVAVGVAGVVVVVVVVLLVGFVVVVVGGVGDGVAGGLKALATHYHCRHAAG